MKNTSLLITHKKIMQLTLLAVSSLTLSFSAFAANQSTDSIFITSLQNWGNGGSEAVYVKTNETAITNPAACSYTGDYFMSAETSEMSRSMLLSAHMANRPVKLVIYGSSCSSNNRPLIVAVKLE